MFDSISQPFIQLWLICILDGNQKPIRLWATAAHYRHIKQCHFPRKLFFDPQRILVTQLKTECIMATAMQINQLPIFHDIPQTWETSNLFCRLHEPNQQIRNELIITIHEYNSFELSFYSFYFILWPHRRCLDIYFIVTIVTDASRAGDKFETSSTNVGYSKYMKLKIRSVGPGDFGSYRCVAKNSLGETDGLIKLDGKLAHFIYIPLYTSMWYVCIRKLYERKSKRKHC